jgi:hypothetical protein
MKIEDVSVLIFSKKEKKRQNFLFTCVNGIFLYKLYNNTLIKLTLNALWYAAIVSQESGRERARANGYIDVVVESEKKE